MKKLLMMTAISGALVLSSCDTLNQYGQVVGALGTPNQTEIANGLKQALEFGAGYSADRLSARDGFYGNLAVKILFPEEARGIERTIRSIGLNNLADNVILTINRAAEEAAKEAKPIFVQAIRQMTIRDASNILLGNQQDAATQYFQRVTSDMLRQRFRPIIQTNLDKVGATRHWTELMSAYNQVPFVTRINPDLADYVTQKAIEGLFKEIAQEELKIRTNISARNTALLQKVFGYADQARNRTY